MRVCIGTSGYGYREWKGKFYPEKVRPEEMLRFYSRHFATVEINNTFYRMPKKSVLSAWAEQVPEDFIFSVKAPQVITHVKRLSNVGAETGFFLKSLSSLGGKLGPVLFQLPASFRADHAALKGFLSLLPGGLPCAFDFRSRTWLEPETVNILHEKGLSLCIEDTDENPAREIVSTASWGYLRLRRSDYTDADLREWTERIFAQTWGQVFVYFKHEGEARGPELALRFREMIDDSQKKRLA